MILWNLKKLVQLKKVHMQHLQIWLRSQILIFLKVKKKPKIIVILLKVPVTSQKEQRAFILIG